jgi:hypothetical protein
MTRKNKNFFRISCALAIMFTAGCAFGGGAAEGTAEDKHTAAANPFTGSWQGSDGGFYLFREDGTGGISASNGGQLTEEWSYLFWYGQGRGNLPRNATLVWAGGDTSDAAAATIKQFIFTVSGETITLIPQTLSLGSNDYYTISPRPDEALTLTRAGAGETKPLVLDNPLIGEWHADWNGQDHDGSKPTWSYKFRPDGTVRTYHHGLHQFDNAYLLRGDTLVILGEWRFNDTFGFTASTITRGADGNFTAKEFHHGALDWVFTRVQSAEWK